MAKGIANHADPSVKPGEFPKCPKGTYEFEAIEFVNLDNGVPFYKDVPYRGMAATIRLIRKDGGNPNPVFSATPLDMYLLVRAFGGDTKQLAKINRTTTEFLVTCDSIIKENRKTLHCVVGENGYVKVIQEIDIPEGLYMFKVVNARSNDGTEPISFQKNNFEQETLWVTFQICGSATGKKSPYDGFQVGIAIQNAWGESENESPQYKLTSAGGLSMPAYKMQKFIAAYCPEMFEDYDYTTADNSEYGIDEFDNPVVPVMEHAIKNGRSALIQYGPNKNGRLTIDLKNINPLEDEEEEDIQEEVQPENPFERTHPMLKSFTDYIYSLCPTAFDVYPVTSVDDLSLSDDGREWAEGNLGEIFAKAEIKKTKLKSLTEEEAGKIMGNIWGDFS